MGFFDIYTVALKIITILLGIASLAGFIITGMWHCLIITGICVSLIWMWYQELISSKGISLWQKKNTEK